jgi:hypothetical protein
MINSKSGVTVNINKIKNCIKHDSILVGYPEGMSHNSGNADLDEIALWMSKPERTDMPARPLLQDGISNNIAAIKKVMKEEYAGMFEGKSPNYNKIGVTAINGIQELVRSDYYKTSAPNAPSTIRSKTSKSGKKQGLFKDKPLINTGQFINGITYTVEEAR